MITAGYLSLFYHVFKFSFSTAVLSRINARLIIVTAGIISQCVFYSIYLDFSIMVPQGYAAVLAVCSTGIGAAGINDYHVLVEYFVFIS